MFDELLDNDPYIQEREERAAALTATKEMQAAVIEVVQARFPDLTDFAQQKVPHIRKPEALHILIKQIAGAPDEAVARWAMSMIEAA